MATATLPLNAQSRQLAIDLRDLLDDLDPARWRDDREAALRKRFADIRTRVSALHVAYTALADQSLDVLRARLCELEEILQQHAPSKEVAYDELHETWMNFRACAEPAYASLAASLKANDVSVPNLRPTNYTRNLFHVGAALICILVVQFFPRITGSYWPVMAIAWGFAIAGWSMELGRRVSTHINTFLMWVFRAVAHPHEAHRINSSTWYTSALALLSLAQSPMIASIALAVLGLGDPIAAIIGKRFGRIRLTNGRSLEGTIAFIIAGTLAALGICAIFHPGLALKDVVLMTLGASTVGGIAELFITRIDDNLAIPVFAGAAALIIALILNIPV